MGIHIARWALALAFSGAGLACAQEPASTVYKWIDAKGLTHYADKPAASGERSRDEQAIGKAQLGAGDDLAAQRRLAQASRDGAQAKRESLEGAKAAQAQQEAQAQRAKACDAAKASARALANGGRVATVNAQGEREFLSDAQIALRSQEALKAQEQACAAAP